MNPYFKRLAWKLGGREAEDLEQELNIFHFKLTLAQVPQKLIFHKAKWFALDYYRRIKKERERLVPLDSLALNQEPRERTGGDFKQAFEEATKHLQAREAEIVLLLCEGYTVREIAREIKASKSGTQRRVKEIRDRVLTDLK